MSLYATILLLCVNDRNIGERETAPFLSAYEGPIQVGQRAMKLV
jgi:hypothetical protein